MRSRAELLGGVLGGLVGGFLTGVGLGVLAEGVLRAQGGLYGIETMGLVAYVLHGTALGVCYAVVMGRVTNWYLGRVLAVTRRSGTAASVLTPLVDRFGVTAVVTTATGLQFGLLAWVALPVVLVPALTGDTPPQLDVVAALAYTVYGLVLGALYGHTVAQ